MKQITKKEKIIFSVLSILMFLGLLTYGSKLAFIASTFLIISSLIFFFINLTKGLPMLKEHQYVKFLSRNVLPFILCYIISVVLFTFYAVSISKGASFKLEYTLSSFPHKESAALPILYGLGLIYGYLRENKKALKITMASLGGMALICLVFYISTSANKSEINNVQFIDGRYTTIEELIRLPQFKDKTVYIDLWFSSCVPCIEQFENYLPQLKKALKDEDIHFLYIARETSHMDSEQRWLNAISKYSLKGWHYYLPKSDEEAMWKKIREMANLNYTGYPHYVIAKDGHITSFDAPKPSEIELVMNALKETTQ